MLYRRRQTARRSRAVRVSAVPGAAGKIFHRRRRGGETEAEVLKAAVLKLEPFTKVIKSGRNCRVAF
jgi:hypothetical protein